MSRDSPKKRHQNHYIFKKTLQKKNKYITRENKRKTSTGRRETTVHYASFTLEKIQGQTLKIHEKIFNGKPRKDSLEFTLQDWTKVRVAFTLEFIRKVNYQT